MSPRVIGRAGGGRASSPSEIKYVCLSVRLSAIARNAAARCFHLGDESLTFLRAKGRVRVARCRATVLAPRYYHTIIINQAGNAIKFKYQQRLFPSSRRDIWKSNALFPPRTDRLSAPPRTQRNRPYRVRYRVSERAKTGGTN